MTALQIDSDAPDVTLKSPEVRVEPVAGKRFGLFSKVLQADISQVHIATWSRAATDPKR
jgi:hypothetical protein